ncbi:MAG: hypothetical protein FWC26_08745 [Fibromonadales bacterium]|nr:hypothetical protein [Fibromonadales bacterium]
MHIVRQIVDSEKLCQIVNIPEDMRYSQVEIIVLPAAAKVENEYRISDKLYGVLREPKVDWREFRGSATKQPREEIDKQLKELRNEWERK